MQSNIKYNRQVNFLGSYLYNAKTTLNSGFRINCTESYLCKRMICKRCRRIRRRFFIGEGLRHIRNHKLQCLVTISWLGGPISDRWQSLIVNSKELSRLQANSRAGPYIKVQSLGELKQTRHLHYIVSFATAQKLHALSKKKWKRDVVVQIKKIQSEQAGDVLGYIYDKNFIPAVLDMSRPRGIRILSASRPMKVGFPYQKRVSSN